MTRLARRGDPRRPAGLTASVLALISAAAFSSHIGSALAKQASTAKSTLSEVTVRATKETQALRVKVDHFVTSVIARPMSSESLMRWNKPVCPLVAGMPREMGEFVLARISQAARAAGAPLAGTHCQPNLFVLVTAHPNAVLKRWLARAPHVNTPHGLALVKEFTHSSQPVRVWYDSEPGCNGPVHHSISPAELNSLIVGGPARSGTELGTVHCGDGVDTQITYTDLRAISYALIVVAAKDIDHVTIGQIADYVGLVGLAEIRPDSEGAGAPTILRLFHEPDPPQGLTPWDRALLYSLYHTDQSDRLQLTDMELSMVQRIEP